ncbi:hypothetical protein [Butyrivibrio sp. MC2021]|uniref:hypothetical protein n=1 Tax=Butyrivibrio sp. MC2021 TaxID=1408306 RepID=UPI00047AB8DB|nr:hypothetical protein [Butyrivibrio sp. MC2021]
MKTRLLNLCKAAVFAVLLVLCLLAAVTVVGKKESSYKYADFFDKAKENQIDVLFMGSSHVINGFNPATLYRDYGFTSYNMGGHGSVMQATYWELIEALDYCTPQWVVVDAYMLEKDYQYLDVMEENADADEINTSVEQLHLNMDAWPLNRLKIAAVKDLIRDQDKRNQFLFDFIVYHDRWSELDENDYRALTGKADRNMLFGAEMRYEVEKTPVSYPVPDEGALLSGHTVGQEYLRKIIDECQRKGIGVVVTYLPFCADTEDMIAARSAGAVAGEYAVPYINMLDKDIIDIRADLNDTGHLNVTGAEKVTRFMGNWLEENGELTDHRGDSAYADWDNKSREFYQGIREMTTSEADLYTELDVLSMNEVGSVIYFNQGSYAFRDDSLRKIVSNIAGTDNIYQANGPYILINDAGSGQTYEAFDDGFLGGVPTAMGNLIYQPVEARFRFLYAEDNEELNYLYDDAHVDYDIQVITYDKETGEVLGHMYYRSYGNNYRVD